MNREEMSFKVKVTKLKIDHPFVKVTARDLEQSKALSPLKNLYDKAPVWSPAFGDIRIAHCGTNLYERCQVTQHNKDENTASVVLIDSDTEAVLPCSRLRTLPDSVLKTMQPLCNEYVLAGVIINAAPDPHYQNYVKKLHDEIINKNFKLIVIKENEDGRFVDLRSTRASLVKDFILQHPTLHRFFLTVDLEVQMKTIAVMKIESERLLMESFKPITLVQSAVSKKVAQLSAPEVVLTPMTEVDNSVQITAYEEGPFGFYVQFMKKENEYQQFQLYLQSLKSNLLPLKSKSVGSRCLVLVDGQLFRAEVEKNPGELRNTETECMVRLLDTGSKVSVSSNEIFRLSSEACGVPSKGLDPPPFSKKFKLQLEEGSITHLQRSEIDFYFQHITTKKLLTLKVVSGSDMGGSCQLFLNNEDVLEMLKRWSPHSLKYLPSKPLSNCFCHSIVCSIDSPNHFYMMRMDTLEHKRYLNMMERLQHFDPPKLSHPRAGDACLIKTDGQYMRNVIVAPTTKNIFKCKAVDTGYVDEYHESEIKVIVDEFLELAPMAIRCCLSGFEKRNEDKETTKCFWDNCRRILEFLMKIVKKVDETYIVELEDLNGVKIVDAMESAASDWVMDHSEFLSNFDTHSPTKKSQAPNPIESVTSKESPSEIKLWSETSSADLGGFLENSSIFNEGVDSDEACPSNRRQIQSPWSSVSEKIIRSKANAEPARITAMWKPTDFTIQKLSKVPEYESFLTKLQDQAMSLPRLKAFDKGSFCLAFNRLTYTWCRAIILHVSLKDFLVSVKCLDDGSTFSVQEKGELRESTISLVFEAYFGIRCSLPIRCNPKREQEAIDYLMSIMNNDLSYEEIAEHDKHTFIELFYKGENVADVLVEKGIAKRQWIVPSGPGFINYVVSTTEFSVQMEKDVTVDYSPIPPIIYKCSLIVPEDLHLSKYAEKKFVEMADRGNNKFKIVMVKPGDNAALVEVYDEQDDNIVNILSSMN